jgi:hypothetical protein
MPAVKQFTASQVGSKNLPAAVLTEVEKLV